jgi:hypothetical protein
MGAVSTTAARTALALGSSALYNVEDFDASGTAVATVDAHVSASDPHPVYVTNADLSAHGLAANPHPVYATDADLAAHAAAADPHAGYVLDATLAAHTSAASPHAGHTTDAEFSAHVAGVDAHPGYVTDAELAAHVAAADPHPDYATETYVNGIVLAPLSSIPDGLVTAPGLAFFDEPNSGFYRDTNFQVKLALNGVSSYTFTQGKLIGPSASVATSETGYVSGGTVAARDYPSGGGKLCTIYKASQLISATTATKITTWDSLANASSDSTYFGAVTTARSTGDIFVGLITGRFQLTLTGYVDDTGGGARVWFEFYKNDAPLTAPVRTLVDLASGYSGQVALSTVCSGTATDTFSVYAYRETNNRTVRNLHFTATLLRS